MRIVVNHLTRMQGGYICIAGIDLDAGRHIRPIPEDEGRFRRPDLVSWGGAFDIGAIVDLGRVSDIGRAPEVEDHRCRPRNARRQGDLTPGRFWDLLTTTAHTRLREIFGDDLQRQGATFATDEGKGRASLGCLALAKPPLIHVTERGDVRLSFTRDPQESSIKVTDLRLYQGNPATPRRDVVNDIMARIEQGVGVILSVGLGRPYQKSPDDPARHWLQINNIHLEDNPIWTERSHPDARG